MFCVRLCALFTLYLSLSLCVCVCVCAQESDIDDNGHVGSMVYVHWLMESVEGAALDRLKTLEVEYKEECFVGQRIQCFVETVAESCRQATGGLIPEDILGSRSVEVAGNQITES